MKNFLIKNFLIKNFLIKNFLIKNFLKSCKDLMSNWNSGITLVNSRVSFWMKTFRVTMLDWRCNAVGQRRRRTVAEIIWEAATDWTHSTEWITSFTTIKIRATLIWTIVWNRCVSVWRNTLLKEPTTARNLLRSLVSDVSSNKSQSKCFYISPVNSRN